MVKNYLVTALRPIQAGSLMEKRTDLYLAYQEMWQMALASYQKFVTEPFEVVVWDGAVPDVDTACMQNWYNMKELWHKEPCNILWVGADTLMLKPTSIFNDSFPEFRMFNCSDPRSCPGLPMLFNDDVRWYPHTMSQQVWDLGEDYMKNRQHADNLQWGFDQYRHNVMFWSQGIHMDNVLQPQLAFQAPTLRNLDPNVILWYEQWNNLNFDQAHIIHFHGSRGSQSTIDFMKQLSAQI